MCSASPISGVQALASSAALRGRRPAWCSVRRPPVPGHRIVAFFLRVFVMHLTSDDRCRVSTDLALHVVFSLSYSTLMLCVCGTCHPSQVAKFLELLRTCSVQPLGFFFFSPQLYFLAALVAWPASEFPTEAVAAPCSNAACALRCRRAELFGQARTVRVGLVLASKQANSARVKSAAVSREMMA